MHNLIRLYNQNRRKFWIIVFSVGLIVMFWWRFIYYLDSNKSSTIVPKEKSQINSNELNTISLDSEKSAITGKKAPIKQDKIDLIDLFYTYCNSGKVQEAYNLISNDCKEEMYSDIKAFQEAFYNPIFGNGRRNITIENWTGDIFMVTLNEDFLATGKYSTENTLQDYVTVTKDKEENLKLNINSYVGRTAYEKTSVAKDLEIKLLRKDTYMDYETYTFEIKNNSSYTALLGNIQDEENVSYLLDKNNLKYQAYVHELSEPQIEVLGKQIKTIKIKYFSEYRSTKQIKALVFPKVYLKYELYNNFENKNNYTDYANITFEL